MLTKNQICRAQINDITSEGSGVCRIDGMAVFVPDTAAGDILDLRIVKVLKNYAYGIIENMIEPSAERVAPDCPHYKQCGGCVFRHINYAAECSVKNKIVTDAFRRIGGINTVPDEFIGGDTTGRYRNKAQYPLAVRDGKAVCGFYAERTHRVIPIEDCPLQPKVFAEIVCTSLDFINAKKLPVYDESSHTGIMRHIYIRQGAHSGEIMVCYVVRKEFSRQLRPLADILTKNYPHIKSVIMNVNPDKTNVILGRDSSILSGADHICDVMCGNTVQISAQSFYQVNTVQAEKLYRKALEYAAPKSSDIVADLYCGVGTIGLSMAAEVGKIVGVEIVPEAIVNAKLNAAKNNISNAEFHCGDAGEVFEKLRQNGCSPDIIVLDPPRKGCSEQTLSTVVSAAPQKVVMISCNPSTAARDAKRLGEHGYTTEKICGVDLFPRTKHVECVVLMSRNKA